MAHPKHIIVVSCLVRNGDEKILGVKHKIRGWEIPQGRVEEGESLLEALHREVLEETGVKIAAPRLVSLWSKLSEPAALIHGFIADYASGDPTPSEETPDVAWFAVQELQRLVEHPVNLDRLADLLAAEVETGGKIAFHSYSSGPYRRLRET